MNKNKKGVGPSLTWILIALIVFTTLISFCYNSYSTFVDDNTLTIDSTYEEYYNNLTITQKDRVYGIGETFENRKVLDKILTTGVSLVNTFIVGLLAIGTLFNMIPVLGSIFNILNEAFPYLSGLIGLLSIIAIVYIAMKYIQAKRGTAQEP